MEVFSSPHTAPPKTAGKRGKRDPLPQVLTMRATEFQAIFFFSGPKDPWTRIPCTHLQPKRIDLSCSFSPPRDPFLGMPQVPGRLGSLVGFGQSGIQTESWPVRGAKGNPKVPVHVSVFFWVYHLRDPVAGQRLPRFRSPL